MGLSALFTGASGAGKTTAAEVIANEAVGRSGNRRVGVKRRAIDFQIDELVLHGFTPRERYVIADGSNASSQRY